MKAHIDARINLTIDKLNSYQCNTDHNYRELLQNEKRKLQKELLEIYDKKAKGNIVRSRIKWIEEGEKSSSYFFKLEKSRQSNNMIKKVKDNQNRTSTSCEGVMNEIVSFYNNLYTSNNIPEKEVDEYLNNINLPNILGESDKKLCDEELTITEIENAILVIKNNRSPGSDGFSTEFYNTLWMTLNFYIIIC